MAESSRIFEAVRHHAVARVSELVARVRFLLGSLPQLPDAFSPDDLPISFILRRDSPSSRRRRGHRNKTAPFVRKADSHSTLRAAGHRPDARSRLRPESHPAARTDGPRRCHLSGSSDSNQRAS